MSCYAIADLHLCPEQPLLLKAFVSLVEHLKSGDELFILGDLFNFFIGLDPDDVAQKTVQQALASARSRGVKSYFIRGNRDFLMNRKEASALNMELLPDLTILSRAGKHILFTHGDLFCTNDKQYMSYRRKVSNPLLQFLFRLLPLSRRRRIGQNLRRRSKANAPKRHDSTVYGVVPETMASYCHSTVQTKAASAQAEPTQMSPAIQNTSQVEANPVGVDLIVHGHLHQLGTHRHEINGVHARMVLGAWGKHLSYFRLDDDGKCSLVQDNISESIISPLSCPN